MRPFHSGSTRSSTLSGSSPRGRRPGCSTSTRLRPENPTQLPSSAWKPLGDEVEDVVGQRAEQALLIEVADRAGRLGQEHVGRRLVALLGDQQRQIGGVAVADLDVDAGLLGEAIEDRLDQVLRPARVDRDRAARRPRLRPAAGGDDHQGGDDSGEDPCLTSIGTPARLVEVYLVQSRRV